MDAITLEVMRNRFFAITEEMGAALIRTAYSTNIKDRRDCSCALFDLNGNTIAQAEHIPVHSGVLPWGCPLFQERSSPRPPPRTP